MTVMSADQANLYRIKPSQTYNRDNSAFIAEVAKLPGTDIDNYSSENMTVLQKILFKWLAAMPCYKDEKFEELFQKPGYKDYFTFNAFKAISLCYGIKFNGSVTPDHKNLFKSIAAGSIGNQDIIYKLKTGRGERLYNFITRIGVNKAMSKISEMKKVKKIYKENETSDNVAIIQFYLHKWLSTTGHKDNNLEITGTFNPDTKIVFGLFNRAHGIKKNPNEVTEKHLELFRAIEYNNYSKEKCLKGEKRIYDLLCKHGYKNTDAILKKENSRKSLASRYGLGLNTMFGKSSFWCNSREYTGVISRENIEQKLGVSPKIADAAFLIFNSLTSSPCSYEIVINGGKRKWNPSGTSLHPLGRALDFTVKQNGRVISNTEAADVAKIIEGLGLNQVYDRHAKSDVRYIDEYNHPSKYSTGEHFHIQSY